jgi:hypothetical protein
MSKLRGVRAAALVAAGMVLGVALASAPAGAHVGGTVQHLWKHLKPKTDARYYTKAKADARFVNVNEELWAVVDPGGLLVRGNGVASSASVGSGTYEVIFKRNVTKCAYVATLGEPPLGTPPGEIAAAGRGGKPKGVFVATYNSAGTVTPRGFTLVVHCGGAG